MKKILTRIKKSLKINKKLFIFLSVLSLIGIISGSILALMLNSADEKLVTNYLSEYLLNIQNNDSKEIFINSLTGVFIFSSVIYLSGLSVVGFFIILLALFWKMFVLGFSVSSIINLYGLKGIIYSFFYIFPHQVIYLFLLLIFSGTALSFSFKIISNLFKERKIDFSGIKKYNIILFLILIFGIVLALYESLLIPKILSFIVNFFK